MLERQEEQRDMAPILPFWAQQPSHQHSTYNAAGAVAKPSIDALAVAEITIKRLMLALVRFILCASQITMLY